MAFQRTLLKSPAASHSLGAAVILMVGTACSSSPTGPSEETLISPRAQNRSFLATQALLAIQLDTGAWDTEPIFLPFLYSGSSSNQAGITGLGLLSFASALPLTEGNSRDQHLKGGRAAAQWISSQQTNSGSLAFEYGLYTQLHNHCFALAGLIAWAGRDPGLEIRSTINKGVNWLLEVGMKAGGQWRGRGFEESLVFGLIGSCLRQNSDIPKEFLVRLRKEYLAIDPPSIPISGRLPALSPAYGHGRVKFIGLSPGSHSPFTTEGDPQVLLWAAAQLALSDHPLSSNQVQYLLRATASGELPPGQRDLLTCGLAAIAFLPLLDAKDEVRIRWAKRQRQEVLEHPGWIQLPNGKGLYRPDGVFREDYGAVGTTAFIALIECLVVSSLE
jgi:hypothetical protein